jgi:uncharacterized protein YjiS (DUF1127 family)
MSMISDLLTWYERSRLRQKLLRMDERRLSDIGYSRALLEDGVRAFPWRLPIDSIVRLGRLNFSDAFRRSDYAKAVAELHAYSDAELSDLGLSRGIIEHAVRHGRPGFAEEERRAA